MTLEAFPAVSHEIALRVVVKAGISGAGELTHQQVEKVPARLLLYGDSTLFLGPVVVLVTRVVQVLADKRFDAAGKQ